MVGIAAAFTKPCRFCKRGNPIAARKNGSTERRPENTLPEQAGLERSAPENCFRRKDRGKNDYIRQRNIDSQRQQKHSAGNIGATERQIGVILTRVIVVCLATIVLGQEIKDTQLVAMINVIMVVVGIKVCHQRRPFRQLLRKRSQALREQDKGKKYGDVIFHTE